MRILVNYSPTEKPFLTQLAAIGAQFNLQFAATSKTLTPGELEAKANLGHCSAILIVNQDTLANLEILHSTVPAKFRYQAPAQ